jgi:hypothetical protein
MSNLSSGTGMRAWLDAAKADGPSAGARTKIWGAISGSGAVGAGAGAAINGAGAAKMLVGGTLLGAAATVGIAATMIYIAGAHKTAGAVVARATVPGDSVVAHTAAVQSSDAITSLNKGVAGSGGSGIPIASATGGAGANAGGSRATAAHVGRANPPEDPLAREAAWLDIARSALARGDGRAALHAARAARSLPRGQLLPEELAVEQQALRKLGRLDQADEVEAELKAQYPESALAR